MSVTDVEVRRAILEFLAKEGCWRARYFPLDTLVNWFGRKMTRDGKRVRKAVRELAGNRFVLLQKKGETISLNPRLSKEIQDYVQRK